ncbi:MAG: DUF2142 domain-containing protein [Sarcina sp.]|nr:DUF2142 domain-containing protein [Sarcina sp.]
MIVSRERMMSNTSEYNRKKAGRKPGNRLNSAFSGIRLYFLFITLLFLFQVLTSGKTTFEGEDISGDGDSVIEINDQQDISMRVTVQRDGLCGVYLDGYLNELNLIFTDEKLFLDVYDTETDEMLAQTTVMAKDQPSHIDQSGTYFAIPASVPKGKEILLRFHSEGFTKRGVFYEVSDQALIDNATYLDGEALDQTLCLSMYYRHGSIDLLRPLFFYVFEFLVGAAGFILHRKYKIPLWNTKKRGRRGLVRKESGGARSLVFFTVLTLVLMVIAAEFAYNIAVKRISGRYDADMLCVDDYDLKTRVAVHEDTVIEEVIRTGKERFCGIGLKVQNNDDDEEDTEKSFYVSDKEKERLKYVSNTVKNVDGFLKVEVFDEKTGEQLVENEYEVGYLRSLNYAVIGDVRSTYVRNEKGNFVYLDFGKALPASSDGQYRIRISGRDMGEKGIRLSSSARTNDSMLVDGKERKSVLCMVTVFDNNGAVRSWYFLIVLLMIAAVTGIGLLVRCFSVREETVFLISILCMGFIFSLVIPPYCVPDERTHVDTIYRISNGVLGIEETPGPGRIYRRKCDIDPSISNTMSLSSYMYRDLHDDLFGSAGDDTALAISYARNGLVNVTVLNYMPGVIGFTLGRLLNRNLMTLVMMARWSSLTVVAILMYFAVRRAPFGKAAFAIIGLLPKMINQIISCSYDGMIIAAVYLFIAYTLHLIYDEDINVVDLLVTAFSACFIACNKGAVYLPLVLLVLALPFIRKRNRQTWSRVSLGILLSCGMAMMLKVVPRIMKILFNASGVAQRSEGGQKLYTAAELVHSPGTLIRLFENTLVFNGQSLFGDMFGITMGQRNMNAHWIVVIAFILLLFFSVIGREDEPEYFGGRMKFFIALITVTGIGLVSVSMLLAWTETGNDTIQGIQGRYYLPYLILPVLCLRNRHIIRRGGADNQALIWMADILLFTAFINLISLAFYSQPLSLL